MYSTKSIIYVHNVHYPIHTHAHILCPSSLVQSFGVDFEHRIEGGGSDMSKTELTGGAKINRIFHERFPFELVKVDTSQQYFRESVYLQCIHVYVHMYSLSPRPIPKFS